MKRNAMLVATEFSHQLPLSLHATMDLELKPWAHGP